jgi:HK97 family phage portal protein
LWRGNPVNLVINKGATGLPISYAYEVSTGKKVFPVDQKTGLSDVFHFYNPSLDDDWLGDSPMRPARAWIDAAREGAEWNAALLENSGRPSGGLEYAGTVPLNEEQKSSLKEQLTAKHSGAKNSGKPMLLQGGLKWVQMGLSPIDMDFGNTLNYADRKIADVYGVPFPLVSPDAATNSNIETATESLYEDVIIPFMESFLDSFSNWLLPRFAGMEGAYLAIDYNSISAYEGKNERKANRVAKLANDGLIKIDEARQEIGLNELEEGGDTVYINSGRVPLGFDLPEDTAFNSDMTNALAK